jgi:hypothetical protein
MVNPNKVGLWNVTYMGQLIFITVLTEAIREKYNGKNVCKICGKRIRNKGSNRRKYCKICAPIMKKIMRQIRKREIGYVNNKDKTTREIKTNGRNEPTKKHIQKTLHKNNIL